jgi:hypothetical protein
VLILGSGCATFDASKSSKVDVTQPGALPPPQELAQQNAAAASGVVPAGGIPATAAPAVSSSLPKVPTLSSIATQLGLKTQPSELALGWRNRVAYLPDPARNGVMSPGLVGQMFLFGYNGSKLEFVEADGVLTVDVIDRTPRPAGAAAPLPERWQFNTDMLKRLQTVDETFGRSYVLFLPWPAYRPDITRVEISARFDPTHGHTLFSPPSILTLENTPHDTPVWGDVQKSSRPLNMPHKSPLIQPITSNPPPNALQPIGSPGVSTTPLWIHPLPSQPGPMPSVSPPVPGATLNSPVASPAPVSTSAAIPTPPAPTIGPMPVAAPPPALSSPTVAAATMSVAAPTSMAPVAPSPPPGLPPIAISVNR